MPRGEKDHATNWLIQNHGRGLLRLAGVSDIRSCRAAHPRLTLPQAIPDGLLEVFVSGQSDQLSVLMEMEAYPSEETVEQVARDMDLAELALGKLPDTVLIVLRPKGRQRQRFRRTQTSPLGWAGRRHYWRYVPLWKVDASTLLEIDEVGLFPLLPLTRSRQNVDTLVEQSRDRIEHEARPNERASLLTITAIMASMRAGFVEQWLNILGGKNVVEHSPLYQKWMADKERITKQRDIIEVLEARFGVVPEEVAARIRTMNDHELLKQAIRVAAKCRSLAAFAKHFE